MLKVLTFNCQRAYQPTFSQYMEHVITSQAYDFILLQESNDTVYETIHTLIPNHNYKLLCHKRGDTVMQMCIIYKDTYRPTESNHMDFRSSYFKRLTESGALMGVFESKEVDRKILVASVHLQASFHPIVRKSELAKIKNTFLSMDPHNEFIHIFGGDFNNLGPGEWLTNDIQLRPNLINVTMFKDHTHDSDYLEDSHKQRPLAKFFLVHRLQYKMKIDHIYIDKKSYAQYSYQSKIIDVSASDHRPIELTLRK